MLPTTHHRTRFRWIGPLQAALIVLAAALGALVLTAVLAAPAGAQTVVDVPQGATITFTAGIIAILTGTVTPILTGLVTRTGTTNAAKAAVSFTCIAVLAVINQIATAPDHTFEVWGAAILFATTFVTHMATWIGIWQPAKAGGPDGAPLNGVLRG